MKSFERHRKDNSLPVLPFGYKNVAITCVLFSITPIGFVATCILPFLVEGKKLTPIIAVVASTMPLGFFLVVPFVLFRYMSLENQSKLNIKNFKEEYDNFINLINST